MQRDGPVPAEMTPSHEIEKDPFPGITGKEPVRACAIHIDNALLAFFISFSNSFGRSYEG